MDTTYTPPKGTSVRGGDKSIGWKGPVIVILAGVVVMGLLAVVMWTLRVFVPAEEFSSRNYSYALRQNSNPFQEWSTTQHEAQTYQYPKKIPVFLPRYGEVTRYMYTENPDFT